MHLHQCIDSLHHAVDIGIKLELPDLVKLCPFCLGYGRHTQSYNAGCGRGMYRIFGSCDFCKVHYRAYDGLGFVYKNYEKKVPESVIFQIYEMNKEVIEVAEELEYANKPV